MACPPNQPPALAYPQPGLGTQEKHLCPFPGRDGGGSQRVFGLSCDRLDVWAGSFSEDHFFLSGKRKLLLNHCRWEIADGDVSGLWLSPEAPRKTRRGKGGMCEPHCISAGGRFTGLNLALPRLPGSFPLTSTAGNSMAQGGAWAGWLWL